MIQEEWCVFERGWGVAKYSKGSVVGPWLCPIDLCLFPKSASVPNSKVSEKVKIGKMKIKSVSLSAKSVDNYREEMDDFRVFTEPLYI